MKLVQNSAGRLRLAEHEEDETNDRCDEACRFLKLDEARIGRDLELYRFMFRLDPSLAPVSILEEVLMPLRRSLPGAVASIKNDFASMTTAIFMNSQRTEWSSLIQSIL